MCIAVRKLSGAAGLAAATAALALMVPGGSSVAQTTAPKPTLTTLVAQAKQLEFQINALSEQYDGLRIQLARAQADARIAEAAATRVGAALAAGQQAVAQLAAENYMNSGLDPTFQALTAGKPRAVPEPGLHHHRARPVERRHGCSTLTQRGKPGAAGQADRRPANRRGATRSKPR